MSLTFDPRELLLVRAAETGPWRDFLVLREEERVEGFTRPVRLSYRHVGSPNPKHPLRDLTDEEQERHRGIGYVKYEEYPAGEGVPGRFWTQWQFEEAGKGCGTVTTAPRAVAESRAMEPDFHASTYCCGCARNLPIGPHGAFTWIEPDGSEAGNRVGA